MKYNVVEIAKAAAVAAGKQVSESTEEVNEQVVNRAAGEISQPAGDVSGQTEKRKAEEMGDGMDVDAAKDDGVEDRAAKQLKVDQE